MSLMIDQDSGIRESLAKALKIAKDRITYYEPIIHKDRVNKYIWKHLTGNQIHYNIYWSKLWLINLFQSLSKN